MRTSQHSASLRGTFKSHRGSRELRGDVVRQCCVTFGLGAAKFLSGEVLDGYGSPSCRFVATASGFESESRSKNAAIFSGGEAFFGGVAVFWRPSREVA